MLRRSLLRGVAAVVPALAATGAGAQEAQFPSRPLRIIVGFAPGGGVDFVARPFAERLAAAVGQPVVVENRAQGLQIEHVPYRGTGPAVQDMVAGRMHLMIDNLSQAKGQIDAGLIRALAVTGPNRLTAVPDVPTTAEAGFPRLIAIGWQAVLAPARTPPAVLAVLRDAGRRVMAQPEFAAFLEARGSVARGRSAAEVADRIQEESAFWGQIIRTANIRLD